MGDLVYVPIVIAFFVVMAGLVGLCDRVIGADDPGELDDEAERPTVEDPEVVSA